MPNAVEDALNRMNADQRAQADQTIEDARRKIQSAEMQMGNAPSGDIAATIAQNEQIIAEAQRSIPAETMQSVDSISPPMNTPPMHGMVNSTQIEVNSTFKSQIESIEQSGGNNYLNTNAVDRALAREGQDAPQHDQQQQELGR